MGPLPDEDQMADMLSNPMFAQTLNEALNNPNIVDQMIRSNPALARMPNAREIIQSPSVRAMLTNPESIRMAARMRRLLQGGGGAGAFPAPGATDTTPAGAPGTAGSAATGNNNNDDPLRALFGSAGAPGNPFGSPAANPFASLLGIVPPSGPSAGTGTTTAQPTAAPSENAGSTDNTGTAGQAGNAGQPPNPFSALFGLGQGGTQGAQANNPLGLPPISPEAMQQVAQMLGLAGLGSPTAAAAPADNRPPEERYAEQLRQLNDMGFFDFDRNVTALRRSGGSVQGAIEYLLSNP
jgi:ubiquilin